MGESLGFKQSLVAAIPWACSACGVYYIPRIADRNPSRRVAISVMCMLAAAVGLALSAFAGPVVAIGALCLSAVGFLSVQPIFWTFLHNFLLVRHWLRGSVLHHDGRFLLVPCSSYPC